MRFDAAFKIALTLWFAGLFTLVSVPLLVSSSPWALVPGMLILGAMAAVTLYRMWNPKP